MLSNSPPPLVTTFLSLSRTLLKLSNFSTSLSRNDLSLSKLYSLSLSKLYSLSLSKLYSLSLAIFLYLLFYSFLSYSVPPFATAYLLNHVAKQAVSHFTKAEDMNLLLMPIPLPHSCYALAVITYIPHRYAVGRTAHIAHNCRYFVLYSCGRLLFCSLLA